jgi:CRP-like cAMP-binding protein
METETFPADATLIRAGEEGDRFYVIVEGRARATNAEGQTLTELGPGSFAGEIAILRGGPRTATVTAVSDVTAVSLSKDDFERILDSSPELRKEFEEISAERLARG